MRLFTYGGSANGYKVELALRQLALPYERVEVEIFRGEAQRPDFLARNPGGRVPVLELDDGTNLVESNAILWHVTRGTRLAPATPLDETRAIAWLSFEQNAIEPVIGSARFWRLTGRDRDRADETARRIAQGRRSLAELDLALRDRPFLLGERYSLADIAVYAYAHLAGDVGIDLADTPNVAAWCRRVEDQPGHVAGPEPYSAPAHVA
ncbi:MAG: glutathione S-transferase family protein [Deltaproteobacteria bacterium]|nr:glutathione S-transferase family protein [Kofleriaceae bacterium]